MKKLQINQIEKLHGGGWAAYAYSCGAAAALLELSFLGGPVIFGANAIYVATCASLLALYGASSH